MLPHMTATPIHLGTAINIITFCIYGTLFLLMLRKPNLLYNIEAIMRISTKLSGLLLRKAVPTFACFPTIYRRLFSPVILFSS